MVVILMSTLLSSEAYSQKIELSPFVGYETGSSVYTSLGYLIIGDGSTH